MSKLRVLTWIVLVALTVGTVLTACQQPKAATKPMLAYIPASPPTAEFSSALLLSMQTYAEKEGFTFVSTAPPASDIRRQMELIESYVAEGVKALVIWPIDSNAIAASIEVANKAKLPVIALDRQIYQGDLVTTVQSDNKQAATLAGQKMVEMLTARYGKPMGKVLEMQAAQTSDVMVMRSVAFQEVIKQYPEITLITKLVEVAADGEKVMLDVLAAHPDLDGVYAPADSRLPPVAGALQQAGRWETRDHPKHVFTASIDATSAALDLIRQGYYDVSISQPVTHFGIAARVMKQYLADGKKPKVSDTLVEEGAYWSPCNYVEGKNGTLLLMQCMVADSTNADSMDLWANSLKKWQVE